MYSKYRNYLFLFYLAIMLFFLEALEMIKHERTLYK